MKLKVTELFILISMVLLSCGEKKSADATIAVETNMPNTDLSVSRGKYMVDVMGCADCHTPKKMTNKGPILDMEKYMMGYDSSTSLPSIPDDVPIGPWVLFKGDLTAAVGPWGTSYATNITPDPSGIGNWSLEQFAKALRESKYRGLDNTRSLMPPMPKHYSSLSDEDVAAMYTYLMSIEPIENVVPAYEPPTVLGRPE